MGTPAAPAATRTASAARDPWIDNGRLVAAILVVSIHMVELHLDRFGVAEWFWAVTWGIRLPLFGMLAGVFSKDQPVNRDFRALVRSVALPLVLMTTVHLLLDKWVGYEIVIRPEVPVYTLWFLYGLIFWRVALPYVARLRRPLMWVTLAALLVGLPEFFEADWALAPIIAHFPFFVLGWKLRPHLDRLRGYTRRSLALAAGLILLSVAVLTPLLRYTPFGLGELTMNLEYAPGLLPTLHSMGTRLAVIAAGIVLAMAMLHLVPRRRLPFISVVGANGFTIYLLHGAVIRIGRHLGWLPVDNLAQWQVPALLGLSVVLAFVLGSTPVARIARPLIKPRAEWMFAAEPDKGADSTGPNRAL
ncbi:acyltransferase family protein [Enemella sp. A6]|uniref:acyltransferase family protein n=1 Tax=Enemella sp. A6 TaxID=3440152 RepID=UPI003EB69716